MVSGLFEATFFEKNKPDAFFTTRSYKALRFKHPCDYNCAPIKNNNDAAALTVGAYGKSNMLNRWPNILGRLFLSFAALSVAYSAAAESFDVLMIGNSYTKGRSTEPDGGTTDDVQGLFDADPGHSGIVVEKAVGGRSLRTHANDPETLALITDSALVWDAIVLQEQSLLPAASPPCRSLTTAVLF